MLEILQLLGADQVLQQIVNSRHISIQLLREGSLRQARQPVGPIFEELSHRVQDLFQSNGNIAHIHMLIGIRDQCSEDRSELFKSLDKDFRELSVRLVDKLDDAHQLMISGN